MEDTLAPTVMINTTPTCSLDDCNVDDYVALLRFRQCILAITLVLKIATLVPIVCHRKLHRQQYIFPINLLLADLQGILTYPISDILYKTTLHNKLEIEDYFYNWNICISSSMSNMTILLVAVYQLITISIDPFGVNGIITTPRCLATCIIFWILTVGMGTGYTTYRDDTPVLLMLVIVINFLVTLATGICYIVTFTAISKRSAAIMRGRRDENRQIMRTLGLVYGTNLVAFACIAALHGYIIVSHLEDQTYCHRVHVVYSIEIVFIMDWFGNTLVYWWRLRDFRSYFRKCPLHPNHVEPFQTNFEPSSANQFSIVQAVHQTK